MNLNICSIDEEGRYGGPQRRTIEVAKEIKKYGVETDVLYPIYDSELFKEALEKSRINCTAIKITRLSLEPKIFIRYILTFVNDIVRLQSFISKGNYDIVQINGTPQYKGVLAAKLAGVPTVWIIEDTQMPFVIRTASRILAKFFASGIIVTGKSVYDYYIKNSILKNKKCVQIHAPVDTKVFDPFKVKPDESMRKNNSKNIITVSGVSPVKGLEYFIRMASELINYDEELIFYVSGAELSSQKKYSKMIKSLIQSSNLNTDNYKFYGMVDNVQSFLAGGDIFVCTSVTEAGPMTVWEAMAMGKAIVTTDVGAVGQYIENGISGYIVPVAEPKALIKRVKELLNNPSLKKRFGKNARIIALQKLDVNIAANKYKKFYEQVLYNN